MRAPVSLRRLLDAGAAGDAGTAGLRRIAGAIGISLVGKVVGAAVGLITLPLIARTLGPDGFGVWTAALAYVGIFALVAEFGLTNAAMQKMAADPENEAEWLGALGSLRTLQTIVLALVAIAGIPLVLGTTEDLRIAALVLTLTIVTSGVAAVLAVFETRLRPGIPVALHLLQTAMWLTAVVVLSTTGAGVFTLAVAYSSLLVVLAVLQVAVTRRHVKATWRGMRARWGSLLRLAVPIGLGGLFSTIYFTLDAILLIEIAGPREAGIFGASHRILEPLLLIPFTIMGALFPVLAAIRHSDPERFERLLRRASEILLLVSLPAVAVALTVGDRAIDVLFGPAFADSASVLPVLMGSFVAASVGALCGYLAPVVGLQWWFAGIGGIGAAVSVGLNIALIPEYGAVGSAWASFATEALTMALLLAITLRRLSMSLDVARLGAVVVAAGVMVPALLVAKPVGLLPALAAGGATFAGVALALGAVRPHEFRGLRAGAPA